MSLNQAPQNTRSSYEIQRELERKRVEMGQFMSYKQEKAYSDAIEIARRKEVINQQIQHQNEVNRILRSK